MKLLITFSALVVVYLCFTNQILPSVGSKILLHPMSFGFNSRLMNMEKMACILRDRGHEVHILATTNYKPHIPIDGVNVIKYYVDPKLAELLDVEHVQSIIKLQPWEINEMFKETWCDASKSLLESQIIEKLKQLKFDLLISDIIAGPTPFLIEGLDIPVILYSNYGIDNVWMYFNNPTFYSFVPSVVSSFSSDMNFLERVQNVYMSIRLELKYREVHNPLDELRARYTTSPQTYRMVDAYRRASLLFAANTHFAYDWPRPVMPHIIPLVGITTFPTNPLPHPFLTFVESAKHGVIILNFGTLAPRFKAEKAEIFAEVFAKLPQRVIWRYTGTKPKALGQNTMLSQWLPQYDLLRHPNVKLFITHCGVSSSFEAMHTATPVIAMPLFWDQRQHSVRLTKRLHMGIEVDFLSFTQSELEYAVKTALSTNVYQKNANRISAILNDQPMSINDTISYWVDYVIKHKGASYLHSEAAYNLNWYQYYLLDVVFAVILVMTFALIFCVCFLKFVCRLLKSGENIEEAKKRN